jgi:hypothetical protein
VGDPNGTPTPQEALQKHWIGPTGKPMFRQTKLLMFLLDRSARPGHKFAHAFDVGETIINADFATKSSEALDGVRDVDVYD